LDDAQFATMKADIAAGTVAYDGRAAGACGPGIRQTAAWARLATLSVAKLVRR